MYTSIHSANLAVKNTGRKRPAANPSKPAAKRRNKKAPSDNEDSDSSVEETPQAEKGNRTPSPLPDEPTVKLPEVIQFYLFYLYLIAHN